MEIYQVGGSLRDRFLGLEPSDIDYVVTGCNSYQELGLNLEAEGYQIVHTYEDKFTYKARKPGGGPVFDFVWARTGEVYSEGKLVSVQPGTLLQDLTRRDFTINAMAEDKNGKLIDPHGGWGDCQKRLLRAVGNPIERFTEDPRRLTRGFRFVVQHGLFIEAETEKCFSNKDLLFLLANPKYKDSTKKELDKAFKVDTFRAIKVLSSYPDFCQTLFGGGFLNLHLVSSSKQR